MKTNNKITKEQCVLEISKQNKFRETIPNIGKCQRTNKQFGKQNNRETNRKTRNKSSEASDI